MVRGLWGTGYNVVLVEDVSIGGYCVYRWWK